jgi:hypothetical protein
MYGPVNAKIASTFLGRQDHGIPTAVLDIDEEHGGSGFGGFDIRVHATYVQTLLDALHVPTWERLPGTVIRVFIRGRGLHPRGPMVPVRPRARASDRAARRDHRGVPGVKLPGILVAVAVASLLPVSDERIDIGPPPAPPRVGPCSPPRKKRPPKAQVKQRIGSKAARRRF